MRRFQYFSPYLVFVALIASLGAFLFGYHTAIISGAVLFITEQFDLSIFEQEILVSSLLIGAVVGALSGGFLADLIGRKRTLQCTVALFLIATFILVNGMSFGYLLVGRIVAGGAIGIASLVVPLYIAEIAPYEVRGTLVSINQLMITLGIVGAYWIAYIYAHPLAWRMMFEVSYVPAIVLLVGTFFIPETPSWLRTQEASDEAQRVLHQLHRSLRMEHPPVLEKRHTPFRSIFEPSIRTPVLIGIGISIFQQITGINTVIYYAPRIFQYAGFASAETAILATVWVGAVNVVMTVVGLVLVDRVGRRVLALLGLGGMAFFLALLGVFFLIHSDQTGWIAVIALLGYIACFAPGLGIVTWLLIAEIYPLGIRGRAMSIASFTNWGANYVVSLTFLTLVELLTIGGTYLLYTLICLFGLLFIWKRVPETKGKTFEEIERFWTKNLSQ
jgi:MFS transporter, SP family, galactose:H+ symporter